VASRCNPRQYADRVIERPNVVAQHLFGSAILGESPLGSGPDERLRTITHFRHKVARPQYAEHEGPNVMKPRIVTPGAIDMARFPESRAIVKRCSKERRRNKKAKDPSLDPVSESNHEQPDAAQEPSETRAHRG